jgi:hypothetical protein
MDNFTSPVKSKFNLFSTGNLSQNSLMVGVFRLHRKVGVSANTPLDRLQSLLPTFSRSKISSLQIRLEQDPPHSPTVL